MDQLGKIVLQPYLNFNETDTAKAMKFYQEVLGGELTMQTFGESRMPTGRLKKRD